MHSKRKIQKKAKSQTSHQKTPTHISSISDIPIQATPHEVYRITVEVERIHERETKTGETCYFLNCRDQQGMSFSVVVWESQWSRFNGDFEEGSEQTIDVRSPKDGYSAYTLV